MRRRRVWPAFVLAFVLAFSACGIKDAETAGKGESKSAWETARSGEEIPAYSGEASVAVNGGIPFFTEEEITEEAFEFYSRLDGLGRCGTAFANVCEEIMPTGERESIGSIRPTGWHKAEYEILPEKYLYNRCHLIGYQLAGENANEKNLITGTRYMNVEGMLPWENMVAEYVEETGNHVLYRVIPDFRGENLVASGVWMEGLSVEDGGEGVCFNVYCYNVQPGIFIDYATGDSRMEVRADKTAEREKQQKTSGSVYVLNTNTKKFHKPSCPSVEQMTEDNKEEYAGDRGGLEKMGYEPCGRCKP